MLLGGKSTRIVSRGGALSLLMEYLPRLSNEQLEGVLDSLSVWYNFQVSDCNDSEIECLQRELDFLLKREKG